jgi:hypothetical protein
MGKAVEVEKKHQEAITACENKILEPAASYFSQIIGLKDERIEQLKIQRNLERERASIEESRADIHRKNAEMAMEVAKDNKCVALALSLEVAELRGQAVVPTAEVEQNLKECKPRLERMELQKIPLQPRRSPEQNPPQLDGSPRAMMLAKK